MPAGASEAVPTTGRHGPSGHPAERAFAWRALRLLLCLVAANLLFNVMASLAGWPTPYRSFLFAPEDRFGDFFKFVLSYPGGEAVTIRDTLGLGARLRDYLANNPFKGIEGLGAGGNTHLMVTPLSTLFSLLNLRAMRLVDPVWLYVGWLLALALWWAGIARSAAVGRTAGLCWMLFGLVSYPVLFMADRGNLFAGIAGLAIVHALLLAAGGRRPLLAGLLLALAISIRPNAVVLGAALVALLWPWRYRVAAAIGLGAAAITVPSLAVAHMLYPDYTAASFLAALRTYYDHYALGGGGFAYNSSLYGALALLFGPDPLLDRLAVLLGGVLLAIALLLYWRGRLDRVGLIFVSCAAYCLASTIFADYHLMAFLAVPLALGRRVAQDGGDLGRSSRIALLAAVLVLAPKHYFFTYPASWQAYANPAILLAATLLIFAGALRGRPVAG